MWGFVGSSIRDMKDVVLPRCQWILARSIVLPRYMPRSSRVRLCGRCWGPILIQSCLWRGRHAVIAVSQQHLGTVVSSPPLASAFPSPAPVVPPHSCYKPAKLICRLGLRGCRLLVQASCRDASAGLRIASHVAGGDVWRCWQGWIGRQGTTACSRVFRRGDGGARAELHAG